MILQGKQHITIDELCKNLPPAFAQFLVRSIIHMCVYVCMKGVFVRLEVLHFHGYSCKFQSVTYQNYIIYEDFFSLQMTPYMYLYIDVYVHLYVNVCMLA
jgi:hypothetical protein